MVKIICCVLVLILTFNLVYAQSQSVEKIIPSFGISSGLGINLIHVPDLIDYLNSISSTGKRADEFGVSAEFFGAPEIRLNDNWGLKVEYAYLVKSYEIDPTTSGIKHITYGIHLPTLIGHYIIAGEGYLFKLGGGLGYHFANLIKEFIYSDSFSYKSNGIGLKIDVEGNTKFDDHLYGYIGLDVRNNFMSSLKKNDGSVLSMFNSNKSVSMNFFCLGFKLGIMYYFF